LPVTTPMMTRTKSARPNQNLPMGRVENTKRPTANRQMSLKDSSEGREFLDGIERLIEEDREIIDALAE